MKRRSIAIIARDVAAAGTPAAAHGPTIPCRAIRVPQGTTCRGTIISVESNDDGVTIYIGITDTSPGSPGDRSSDGDGTGGDSSGTWTCTANPMELGLGHSDWLLAESPLHPGDSPWTVECDDGYFGVVWVPDRHRSRRRSRSSSVHLTRSIRCPSPPSCAIICPFPTWPSARTPTRAWWHCHPGSGLTDTTERRSVRRDTLGGVTVEVQIVPQRYTWSFGDGGTLETTSPGEPYPAESDIQHSYEQSSLGAGGAFAVTVEISFSAQYRVNGGAWQSLDAITRSFTGDYPVQQLQSVLTED